jgi:type III secretion protein L
MVIWLRNPQLEGAGAGLGVEQGVVRAAELGRVVEIDAALQALREQGEAELAAARAQAHALLEAAEARAAELIAEADQQYESAERDGYEAGLRAALTDWHERVAQSPQADGRTLEQRERDRLAELVALAVEQMIATSDPADVFRRAAATLEQILADGSPLDVRVHPSDLEAARRAFGEVAHGWRDAGCAVRLRVHADAALEPGSCVCESDLGTVDASLSLQLQAMRAALARAVDSTFDDRASSNDADDHEFTDSDSAADDGFAGETESIADRIAPDAGVDLVTDDPTIPADLYAVPQAEEMLDDY